MATNYEFMDEEQRAEQREKLDAELNEYMEKRRAQWAEEAAELEQLKEHQAERKQERAREMEEMQERMNEAEAIFKAEEEEKRQRMEEEKRQRILLKMKSGGTSVFDVFGKEGNPKNETVAPTPEELAQAKKDYLANTQKKLNIDGLGTDDLRKRCQAWYDQIVKLEGTKYDLEQRQKEQEVDMRELGERESQKARAKAKAEGLDEEEAAKSKFPPKIRLYSKNDRQIDRRPYAERQDMWNQPASEKVFKICHGSGKPPPDWHPEQKLEPGGIWEELENIKRNWEGSKYQEVEPVEGAKTPGKVIPLSVPEKDSFDIVPVDASAPAPDPAPSEAPPKADQQNN